MNCVKMLKEQNICTKNVLYNNAKFVKLSKVNKAK